MRQLPLPVRLRASSVFDSFYAGPNEAAVRELGALKRHVRPPVVWLHGPGGTGKTHLLQAVCARTGVCGEATAYLPLAELSPLQPGLLEGCEALSFVCIDDLDRIAGDEMWERALFRLYTELEESGGRLVIAASVPPNHARIALPDLASRLAAGCVLWLRPLDDEQQLLALQARAAQLGLELPTETAQYLLRRLPRNMTTLCDELEKLDEASLATQRRLTVPFVRQMLERSS